jgi:hypothetical protein
MAIEDLKRFREALSELEDWRDHVRPEHLDLVLRLLASVPGGERADEAMLGDLLSSIRDRGDVEEAVDALLGDEEEDEDDEETS